MALGSPRSTRFTLEPDTPVNLVGPEAVRVIARSAGAARDAWRELYTATYPTLAGWVRRLVDDDDTAHEIAAEAFTRLMAHWSRPDDPHAYLYKIATNLVREHWRKTRRER